MKDPIYKVRDWDKHFENSRSRAVSELRWVSIPNKHDGEGYGLVMEQDDAAELFAAWVLIVQVASKCRDRGTLTRDDGSPLTAKSLARKTHAPVEWFAKALDFFTHKNLWLECHPTDTEPSPAYQASDNLPSPGHQASADRMEGNGIEENGKEENPSLPSSETYDSPHPESLPPEGRKDGSRGFEDGQKKQESPALPPSLPQDEPEDDQRVDTADQPQKPASVDPVANPAPCTEAVFLAIARKLHVPEEFAARVFLDLTATGWTSANGSRVVSPASYLRDLWTRAKAKEVRSGDGGPREPWQIDADIKRVREEIRRIETDPASRNPAGPTWDEHREQFEGDWLALVQRLHDEARKKLPGEFRRFEAKLAEAEKEARKGGTYDADPETARVFRLVQFAEAFPEDCPDFARWDREWNRGKTWTDPKALNSAARAEIKLIRQRLKTLEEERRRALVADRA